MTDNETITKIHELIRWLEVYGKSQDISGIALKQQELSIHAFWFAENVAEAFTERNNSETNWKAAVARSISGSPLTVAKSERLAAVEFEDLEKEYVNWDNLYSRFALKLKAIDRVLDNTRQRVSVIKQIDLKHGNEGGI